MLGAGRLTLNPRLVRVWVSERVSDQAITAVPKYSFVLGNK